MENEIVVVVCATAIILAVVAAATGYDFSMSFDKFKVSFRRHN